MKVCNKCLESKPIECYYSDKYKKDGLKTICIQCQKNYILKNSERNKDTSKLYYENNKEKISERKKKYNLENKNKLKEYRKEYNLKNRKKNASINKLYYQDNKVYILDKFNNRLKNDSFFKLKHNLRTNVRNSLTKYGYTKKSKTYELIGIDYISFKKYIEAQFKEGMNWENYGEWHLDHKIPISWAKNENEAIELCHYSNYQPLWAFDNLSKGNRYKN